MKTKKRFRVSVWEACKKDHQEFFHVYMNGGYVNRVDGRSEHVVGTVYWNNEGRAFDSALERIPSEDIDLVEPNSNENEC